ncbi:Na+/H+ antiporter NhaA [Sphingomonas sp. Leaf343]|uniref:Na+/H+ antiporter NhaA n=1 Tax=Sphingomonas sp. Leaf343 TaxID=1736345 RepID=UPI0006FE072B|nr:Na+/H+ antiporter NhaA [Sphingomonas sp. Leaf343]KQR87797.1 sodium:proton antiporter [Sphingomonas sp. Leaf343]
MIRRRPLSPLRAFLVGEAGGGAVLMAAAVVAMIAANLPATAPVYEAFLHWTTGPTIAPALGPMTVHLWINDAAMALFFLLVGLEIKRELIDGQLANPKKRRLPVIVAAAGMAVPALIYLAVAGGTPGLARGWAIPAATDIAFAVGILALLGSRVPPSLKIFLTAVAIVDDMGAVAIIALAYTPAVDLGALAAATGTLAAMMALNRHKVGSVWPYMLGFVVLWYCVLLSGVHATVAGVLAAAAIPLTLSPGVPDEPDSPLHRIEHALAGPVLYGIVPLFAFANAGVSLRGLSLETLSHPLVVGIAAGLFVGKQAGVLAAIWLAERFGLAKRPGGAGWTQVYGVALLAGIGFTMSLFIGQLAFPDNPVLAEEVKLGVLGGSIASAVIGYCVLRLAASKIR